MRAFVVLLNGKELATGGVGCGVLAANVTSVDPGPESSGHDEVGVQLGGLDTAKNEHVEWLQKRLRVGDEVRIRVVNADAVDRPHSRKRRNAAQELREQKQYVRNMAKKLGWTIRANR